MSEFPGLETQHHGLRDFGQEIAHELEEVFHHDKSLADEFRKGLPKDHPVVVVRESRPDRIYMRTIVLPARPFEITDMARYTSRDSILISNQSASDTVAVGASDTVAVGHLTAGGPSVAIPAGVARKFLYNGPLWVVGTAGDAIDVVIESYSNE